VRPNHSITRNLYKSIEGDRIWFEEINHPLGLSFCYGWATAEEFGFVRRCTLANLSGDAVSLRVVDGLRHLLPPGIGGRLQSDSSCLVDAYKTAERVPGTSLALYSLTAGIVDRAIPMESLRAAAVWSAGLPEGAILLSDRQLANFYDHADVIPETHRRGLRFTYAVDATLTLSAFAQRSWMMAADTNLSQADVVSRRRFLTDHHVIETVERAIEASTQRLRSLVGAADGVQAGGEDTTTAHHFANTLFNLMRGGIFVRGHEIPGRDFAGFVRTRNRAVATRHDDLLVSLPESLSRSAFLEKIRARPDRDLERLALEYVPLTFSRRHGDPSRPWNRFNIRVRDEHGGRILHHEGNWRDIFQNWEALCLSFPDFIESVVAKFLNASTIDGYNPYRLSHAGLDWEVPDLGDPWSSIGYWGDHQTIYLLKLLEWSGRFHPGLLTRWLRCDLFAFADVPYRIAGYAELRQNPHVTIEFDAAKHEAIMQAVASQGTDARLRHSSDGRIVHVSLTEKLLLLVLTRLSNFVPGGGIWMNTQRPEWNDANNALVGYGVSMVTLCYLRRFLAHFERQLLPALGSEPVSVSAPLANLAREILTAFEAHRDVLATSTIGDDRRRSLLDALAGAGSSYRAAVYRNSHDSSSPLGAEEIGRLLSVARIFVDHTIRANVRPDGLFHSYNLLEFTENPPELKIHSLAPMLEGQVAVLSSGALSPAECVTLLRRLRRSPLYRPDQNSYLLYPDRELPGFLERNLISADDAKSCALFTELHAAGDLRLVVRDDDGRFRFHPDLVNGDELGARLNQLATEPQWNSRIEQNEAHIRAIYERVFHHRSFTGRSGSMFGYEGLGCIYWHMVAKLLVAVQENLVAAESAHDPAAVALTEIYHDIRDGLGFNKTPSQYGAFPTDPYSHTPGHSGAQQPGMTGQVKEELLTRLGELGVRIENGTVSFIPTTLRSSEFSVTPFEFRPIDVHGDEVCLTVPDGSLAFTFCGVPIVYRRTAGPARVRIQFFDSTVTLVNGTALNAEQSAAIFGRTGRIRSIEVSLGESGSPE
jgi:hypothetical protein